MLFKTVRKDVQRFGKHLPAMIHVRPFEWPAPRYLSIRDFAALLLSSAEEKRACIITLHVLRSSDDTVYWVPAPM